MACKINQEIDVETFRQTFAKPLRIKIKDSKKSIEWKMKENGFYNQVTVEFVDGTSKKSIKFFPNGTVHVTGCSDIDDCHKVMNLIRFVVSFIVHKDDVKVDDFKIFMINTNFSMNSTLNLQSVITCLRNLKLNVSFNPEVYSAVKVKFSPDANMKQVTASIFSSGCVLITGATNLKEINASYKFLIDILTDCRISANSEVQLYDYFMGRNFEYWRKIYC